MQSVVTSIYIGHSKFLISQDGMQIDYRYRRGLQFYRVDMMCSVVHIKKSWVWALYLLMHWLLFKATAFTPRLIKAANMLQSAQNCPYPNNCHLKSDWTFWPVEPSFQFIELQNLLSPLGFGLRAIIARYNYHICSCEK